MAKISLIQFMEMLKEEGIEGEDFERALAEFNARRAGTSIERQGPRRMTVDFPGGPQNAVRGDGRVPMDYGEESPAEAKDRWMRQEMEDPNGILSPGGSTAGGIFGDGAISGDGFDPGSYHRGAPVVQAQAARLQAQVSMEQLRLIERMDQRLRDAGALPKRQVRNELEESQPRRRLLRRRKE